MACKGTLGAVRSQWAAAVAVAGAQRIAGTAHRLGVDRFIEIGQATVGCTAIHWVADITALIAVCGERPIAAHRENCACGVHARAHC